MHALWQNHAAGEAISRLRKTASGASASCLRAGDAAALRRRRPLRSLQVGLRVVVAMAASGHVIGRSRHLRACDRIDGRGHTWRAHGRGLLYLTGTRRPSGPSVDRMHAAAGCSLDLSALRCPPTRFIAISTLQREHCGTCAVPVRHARKCWLAENMETPYTHTPTVHPLTLLAMAASQLHTNKPQTPAPPAHIAETKHRPISSRHAASVRPTRTSMKPHTGQRFSCSLRYGARWQPFQTPRVSYTGEPLVAASPSCISLASSPPTSALTAALAAFSPQAYRLHFEATHQPHDSIASSLVHELDLTHR